MIRKSRNAARSAVMLLLLLSILILIGAAIGLSSVRAKDLLNAPENLLANGDFEDTEVKFESAYDRWVSANKTNLTLSYDGTDSYSGSNSLKATLTANASVNYRFLSPKIGSKYYFEFYFKDDGTNGTVMKISSLQDVNPWTSAAVAYYTSPKNNAWTKVSGTFLVEPLAETGFKLTTDCEQTGKSVTAQSSEMISAKLLQFSFQSNGNFNIDSFIVYEYYDAEVTVEDSRGNHCQDADFTLMNFRGEEISEPAIAYAEDKYTISELYGPVNVRAAVTGLTFGPDTKKVNVSNPSAAFSPQYSTQIEVKDAAGALIPDAKLLINGEWTDGVEGLFALENLSGSVQVKAKALGYRPEDRTLTLKESSGKTLVVTLVKNADVVALSDNVINNPGAEQEITFGGVMNGVWGSYPGNITLSRDDETVFGGNYSIKVNVDNIGRFLAYRFTGLTQTEKIKLSFWAYSEENLRVDARINLVSGSGNNRLVFAGENLVAKQWTKIEGELSFGKSGDQMVISGGTAEDLSVDYASFDSRFLVDLEILTPAAKDVYMDEFVAQRGYTAEIEVLNNSGVPDPNATFAFRDEFENDYAGAEAVFDAETGKYLISGLYGILKVTPSLSGVEFATPEKTLDANAHRVSFGTVYSAVFAATDSDGKPLDDVTAVYNGETYVGTAGMVCVPGLVGSNSVFVKSAGYSGKFVEVTQTMTAQGNIRVVLAKNKPAQANNSNLIASNDFENPNMTFSPGAVLGMWGHSPEENGTEISVSDDVANSGNYSLKFHMGTKSINHRVPILTEGRYYLEFYVYSFETGVTVNAEFSVTAKVGEGKWESLKVKVASASLVANTWNKVSGIFEIATDETTISVIGGGETKSDSKSKYTPVVATDFNISASAGSTLYLDTFLLLKEYTVWVSVKDAAGRPSDAEVDFTVSDLSNLPGAGVEIVGTGVGVYQIGGLFGARTVTAESADGALIYDTAPVSQNERTIEFIFESEPYSLTVNLTDVALVPVDGVTLTARYKNGEIVGTVSGANGVYTVAGLKGPVVVTAEKDGYIALTAEASGAQTLTCTMLPRRDTNNIASNMVKNGDFENIELPVTANWADMTWRIENGNVMYRNQFAYSGDWSARATLENNGLLMYRYAGLLTNGYYTFNGYVTGGAASAAGLNVSIQISAKTAEGVWRAATIPVFGGNIGVGWTQIGKTFYCTATETSLEFTSGGATYSLNDVNLSTLVVDVKFTASESLVFYLDSVSMFKSYESVISVIDDAGRAVGGAQIELFDMINGERLDNEIIYSAENKNYVVQGVLYRAAYVKVVAGTKNYPLYEVSALSSSVTVSDYFTLTITLLDSFNRPLSGAVIMVMQDNKVLGSAIETETGIYVLEGLFGDVSIQVSLENYVFETEYANARLRNINLYGYSENYGDSEETENPPDEGGGCKSGGCASALLLVMVPLMFKKRGI